MNAASEHATSTIDLARQRLIGPFPPPTGGVAVAALTVFRALSAAGLDVERFDTSGHAERENIYRARGARSALRNVGLALRLLNWVINGPRHCVYHLFVTSDRAFIRDRAFLSMIKLAGRSVIVHLHSKTAGEYHVAPHRLQAFGKQLNRADRIVVLSEVHREFFAQYIPADKLQVLENFVISDDFETDADAPAARILYLSRISEMKGIWELVQSLAMLASARPDLPFSVTIAGTADLPATQQELKNFVERAGLVESVCFVGHVEGSEKMRLFREHGVFVFPSRFENSPITLKEAAQAGMAVVASDISANHLVLDRCANAVYFAVGDAEALESALARVLEDHSLYTQLRRSAMTGPKYDENYAVPILRRIAAEIQRIHSW